MATFAQDDNSVVVIIGSGAGGGTLANALAKQKIRSVVLEAGKRFTLDDIENDEWAMFKKISWLDKRIAAGGWHLAENNPNLPAWIVKTVGGSTVHWAGIALRFRDFEFKMQSINGDIAGANLLDWPVTLKEMAPWYEKAEKHMGVTGPSTGMAYHPWHNSFKVLATGAKRVGYKEILSGPMAINTEPYDDRAACQQIGFCMQGCKMGAKWSTLYTDIPAPKLVAIAKCAHSRWCCASNTTPRAAPVAWSMPMPRATSSGRRPAWCAWRATPSSRRGCCSTPRPRCSPTGWPIPPARSGATT